MCIRKFARVPTTTYVGEKNILQSIQRLKKTAKTMCMFLYTYAVVIAERDGLAPPGLDTLAASFDFTYDANGFTRPTTYTEWEIKAPT